MAKLAPLLDRLARHDEAAATAGESAAKLVLSSGKRSRIEGEGDFETISAAALGEDDVRDLLQQTGAGSRLDKLGARAIEWSFRHEGSSFHAEATHHDRTLKATIVRVRPDQLVRPRPASPAERPALREEVVSSSHDPRSEVSSVRPHDPRSEEEPAPRGDRPDKRRDEDRADRRREDGRRSLPPPAVEQAAPAPLERHPAAQPEKRGATPPSPAVGTQAPSSDADAWRDVVATSSRSASLFAIADNPDMTLDLDPHERPTVEPRPPAHGGGADTDALAERIASRRGSLPPVFGFDEPPPPPRAPSAKPPPPASIHPGHPGAAISIFPAAPPAPGFPTLDHGGLAGSGLASGAPRDPTNTVRIEGRLARLIEQAQQAGASDLHLATGRPAIARLGGVLSPAGPPLDEQALEAMLLPSMGPERRATFERNGSVSFAAAFEGGSSRCRIAISRQRTGLKASVRILQRTVPTASELGLPEGLLQAIRHHQGLVLVSGPSGQGKTTTLAALVDHLNATTTHHILTVEDPIEYVHGRKTAMMSQREVGTHTMSFGAALRSSLREDPDVIVVGELRDVETVRTALSASETGHLVLGTLNTPSAPKTIDRLIDLFPPPEQPQVRATLAAALRLVASQRLLPRAGGNGRVAAIEVLPGSLALSNLIRDARTFQIPSLMQRGRSSGVVRLDDELADMVRRGVVERRDAVAAADDPQELIAALDGKAAGEAPATRAEAPATTPDPGEERTGGRALWQRAADMFRRGER